jgi:hypothetical protein
LAGASNDSFEPADVLDASAGSVGAAGTITTQWLMRLRRLLVFLGLVMANCASSGRSHQTVMARKVPDGTANDRTSYATLCLSRNRRYGNDERQCSAA